MRFRLWRHAFYRLDNYACWYGKFKQHMVLYEYSQKAARKYAEVLVLEMLRIGKAEELLRKTDLNVSEIADATGFRDRNYFSSAFKHATGRTPSEFRNHMR